VYLPPSTLFLPNCVVNGLQSFTPLWLFSRFFAYSSDQHSRRYRRSGLLINSRCPSFDSCRDPPLAAFFRALFCSLSFHEFPLLVRPLSLSFGGLLFQEIVPAPPRRRSFLPCLLATVLFSDMFFSLYSRPSTHILAGHRPRLITASNAFLSPSLLDQDLHSVSFH